MKIYTKTGDQGTTGLFGGGRVSKDSPRIIAYGDVDELNAVIGMARAEAGQDFLKKILSEVQEALFVLGAQLASPGENAKGPVITSSHIEFLESQIDLMQESLPELRQFILPGGTRTSACLHLARTVCRRAERNMVHLSQLQGENLDKWALIYVNRLSDFLFVVARLANQLEKVDDIPWNPPKR